jgi:hypothetical protein
MFSYLNFISLLKNFITLDKNTAGLTYEKFAIFPKLDAVWDKSCTRIWVATQAEKIINDKI